MDAAERKIAEALEICKAIGIDIDNIPSVRTKRLALALLAAAKLKPRTPWSEAAILSGPDSWAPTTRRFLKFWNENYGTSYADASYDDVKRRDLIVLEEANVVIGSALNPNASTNAGTRGYAIPQAAADVLRTFGTPAWQNAVRSFVERFGRLSDRLKRPRQIAKIPVRLPSGVLMELDKDAHNELQAAVIAEFLPRFAPGAHVLYLGDAGNKMLHKDEEALSRLHFFKLEHERLPDIIAYDANRNWLFLVEAVHSINPITPLRHLMYERMAKDCTAPIIYVSVFQSQAAFARFADQISWETEVWLVDNPDHMIHFNGGKFLGPHQPTK